jgi:hypothetical protein
MLRKGPSTRCDFCLRLLYATCRRPATLCHLSRRYDYCMGLFQPRDILDPLSSFFLLCLGQTLNRRRTNFVFSHLTVDVRYIFSSKIYAKVAGF